MGTMPRSVSQYRFSISNCALCRLRWDKGKTGELSHIQNPDEKECSVSAIKSWKTGF